MSTDTNVNINDLAEYEDEPEQQEQVVVETNNKPEVEVKKYANRFVVIYTSFQSKPIDPFVLVVMPRIRRSTALDSEISS